MDTRFIHSLRQELAKRDIIPFIGAYDVFSTSIAAKYYDGIFISGFGFAAAIMVMYKNKIINKTMDLEDLKSEEAKVIIEDLNSLIKNLREKAWN